MNKVDLSGHVVCLLSYEYDVGIFSSRKGRLINTFHNEEEVCYFRWELDMGKGRRHVTSDDHDESYSLPFR